jgi:multidrug efflux pump
MSMWALAIRRPVLTTVAMIAMVLFGTIGYLKLPVRELPDIDFPVVTVTTVLPGASPEVVEKEVTEILEEEINTIEGIRTLRSESAEQVSSITVEFELERDIDVAAQDVRDKVARVRDDLPEEAEVPVISKLDLDAQAIMWTLVNAEGQSLRAITDYADNVVKERLQRLPGVGSILLGGAKRFAVRVRLDAQRLAAYRLTVNDVVGALQRENVEIPSGRIESAQRDFVVKTDGEFPTPEAFNELVIAYRDDVPVRLRQVGVAEAGDENERSLGRWNLRPTVALGVLKQSNANTVSVARAVRAEIAAVQGSLPPGYSINIGFDAARFIEESVAEVTQSLITAGALVVLVIFVFLHTPRSAVIPALAIPSSILATFAFMYFLGFTVNNLTLLALTLSIGIVVDDAIIVLENVHRHLESGMDRRTAAVHGTGEIAFAAMAATVSLAVVFLPVAFITGIIGRFFYEFGVAVAVAVLLSAFVALTLTPLLCSRILAVDVPRGIFRHFDAGLRRVSAAYARLLGRALHHRGWVVTVGTATAAGCLVLFLAAGKEFVPSEDRGSFMVVVETPQGSTLAYHDERQRRVEELIVGMPELRSTSAFIGLAQGGVGQVNRGLIFNRMKERTERQRSQQEVVADLRERVAAVPGVQAFILTFSGLSTGSRGKPLQFVIQNPDFDALTRHSARMLERAREIPGLVDVDSDLELNKPELRLTIDRNKAAALGVSAADVANTLRVLLGGDDVTTFTRGNERYEVIVQLRDSDRRRPDQLGQIYLRTRSGDLTPLANVVQVAEGVGPSRLNHFNRRRSVVIDANLSGIALGEALDRMHALASEMLPPGFTTSAAGESRDFQESVTSLTFTFILAVIAVYLVLAAQFESFVHPFTVLLALPLAIFGALLCLYVFGMTVNVYSFIGMVMLVGLVTKNSILLVDCANGLRAQGHDLVAAVARAGALRLRPILMTAISTLFGALPVALGLGAGAESRRPLGVAVVGGMAVSTLLTLVLVPVAYTLVDDGLGWLRRSAGALTRVRAVGSRAAK